MHDCTQTKEQVTELLLDGAARRPDAALARELRECIECRAEFDAISATLRITTRLNETVAPTQEYWNGYHERLEQKLRSAGAAMREPVAANGPTWIEKFFKSSVRVPVPVGLAVIAVCAVLIPIAIRASRSEPSVAQNPTIIHVPVEVPLVQEKIVTRVVYRERRSRMKSSNRFGEASRLDATFAKSQEPATLKGFKPSEEIKLTVIKGGSAYEK